MEIRGLNEWDNPEYPEPLKIAYADCIAQILTVQPLPHLVDFSLGLFNASDFSRVLRHEVQKGSATCPNRLAATLAQLRHLTVRVGCTSYSKSIDTDSLFEFFRMAGDLRSLSVLCTYALELPHVAIAGIFNLENLQLKRMTIHATTLSDLFARSAGTLRSIYFLEVELRSGTWESLFTDMCRSPRLINVKIQLLGYAYNGKSKRYNSMTRSALENQGMDVQRDIETRRVKDNDACVDFERAINTNRIREGLEPHPDMEGFPEAFNSREHLTSRRRG